MTGCEIVRSVAGGAASLFLILIALYAFIASVNSFNTKRK